jgi:hypothetical protein|tara:strand:+ start:342 stop:578 length:237 start_codon:yes stop_codon:yes gene_type:complete
MIEVEALKFTTEISQADYKIFTSKVKKLASKGIHIDYKVAKPNHKKVKLTMNKVYDWEKLDDMCENDTRWEDPLGYGY